MDSVCRLVCCEAGPRALARDCRSIVPLWAFAVVALLFAQSAGPLAAQNSDGTLPWDSLDTTRLAEMQPETTPATERTAWSSSQLNFVGTLRPDGNPVTVQQSADPFISPEYGAAGEPGAYGAAPGQPIFGDGTPYWWRPQFLPNGLLYKTYLAGPKEPRFASMWLYEFDKGWIWDVALGARVGIVRIGSDTPHNPQGFQIDLDGAAFPRLDMENQEDLESADFRVGVPLTWAYGPWHWKIGYDHISSHVGDEFLKKHPGFERLNYVRDAIVFGLGYYITPDLRVYGEASWGFHVDVAEPWALQFGVEYSPTGIYEWYGTPFWALNAQLFEEHDFGGGFNAMAGWQWRSRETDRRLRAVVQYFNGKSAQYAFFDEHEQLLGLGLMLDF